MTVAAPAAAVWPWLVQMGHKRAGWYGLDWFDNEGVDSAERLVPELQHLEVGDVIPDAIGPFGFHVALLEPGRALAYRATIHPITGRPVQQSERERRPYIDFSWAFILDPVDERTTRLLARVRYSYPPHAWIGLLVHVFELADTVFSLQTLTGIKRRAETTPAEAADPALLGSSRPAASCAPSGS